MLRHMESFDTTLAAHLSRKYALNGTPDIDTGGSTPPRTGRACASWLHNSTFSISKELDDQSTWIVGFAWYSHSVPGTNTGGILILLDSAGAEQLSLEFVGGKLAVFRGATQIAIGTTSLPEDTWVFIEMKATIANAGGTVEVRLNGVTEISFTGDTQNSASLSTARTIRLQNGEGTTATARSARDDWYICDGQGSKNNDFLGDVKVVALLPQAEGAHSSFTPSAGTNNALNVDDTTSDDDTTYNASATAGHKDTYTLEDLPSGVADVIGIRQSAIIRKDDAGSRSARLLLRSGATESAGSTSTVFDSYQELAQIREDDPATSTTFLPAAVNSLEAGIEVVS